MFHNAFSVTGIMKLRMMVYLPISCDLREWREAIKWIFRIVWRYRLIWNRCRGDHCGYCGDSSRCVATRRHTFRTGTDLRAAHLEKRPLNRVHISNRCRVFQCTVNWSRARHRTAFIAGGACGSRGSYSVEKWTGESVLKMAKWSPHLF